MSNFTILYFSGATVYTKRDSETFPAPMSLKTLLSTLEEKYPGIKAAVLERSMVTVNLEYVDMGEDVEIKAGQEVAVIPPVSAG